VRASPAELPTRLQFPHRSTKTSPSACACGDTSRHPLIPAQRTPASAYARHIAPGVAGYRGVPSIAGCNLRGRATIAWAFATRCVGHSPAMNAIAAASLRSCREMWWKRARMCIEVVQEAIAHALVVVWATSFCFGSPCAGGPHGTTTARGLLLGLAAEAAAPAATVEASAMVAASALQAWPHAALSSVQGVRGEWLLVAIRLADTWVVCKPVDWMVGVACASEGRSTAMGQLRKFAHLTPPCTSSLQDCLLQSGIRFLTRLDVASTGLLLGAVGYRSAIAHLCFTTQYNMARSYMVLFFASAFATTQCQGSFSQNEFVCPSPLRWGR